MSQVVPAVLGTVRTRTLEGLTYGTCWDVLSSPKACWDHRTVRGNPGHVWKFGGKADKMIYHFVLLYIKGNVLIVIVNSIHILTGTML